MVGAAGLAIAGLGAVWAFNNALFNGMAQTLHLGGEVNNS